MPLIQLVLGWLHTCAPIPQLGSINLEKMVVSHSWILNQPRWVPDFWLNEKWSTFNNQCEIKDHLESVAKTYPQSELD